MRKQIKLLKHHPNIAPNREYPLSVLSQLYAVNDDTAALPVLEPIDAT
jgi:hypothetical protein